MCKQLSVNEVFGIIDDHHHDGLGYEISRRLRHDAHVGVDQVPDGLHLPLKLRVHATCACAVRTLQTDKFFMQYYGSF